MGNTSQTCQSSSLEENGICKIAKCTEKVTGFSSNSISPTDIWSVTLFPNTNYGNSNRIVTSPQDKVILKIYLSKLCKNNLPFKGFQFSDELFYESRIYETIIKPITIFNKRLAPHNPNIKLNPHFVEFCGNAYDCNFNNMYDIITNNKLTDTSGNVLNLVPLFSKNTTYSNINVNNNNDIIKLNMLRNTVYMYKPRLFNPPKRPSITDVAVPDKNIESIIENILSNNIEKNIYYNIIATKQSTGKTYMDFFNDPRTTYLDKCETAVQIISALVVLDALHCSHNDMHYQNIMLETSVTPIERHYIFTNDGNSYYYKINSKYTALLYDWDKSYVKKLGDNPGLWKIRHKSFINSVDACYVHGLCNEHVRSKDISIFIMRFCTYVNPIPDNATYYNVVMPFLREVLFKTTTTVADFTYFFSNIKLRRTLAAEDDLFDTITNGMLNSQFIKKNFRTPSDMLLNFMINVKGIIGKTFPDTDESDSFKALQRGGIDITPISVIYDFRNVKLKELVEYSNTEFVPLNLREQNEFPSFSSNEYSPKRKSPKRKSPKRKSPKRKSPKRKSPKRKSPKRKSPKRKSPKRKSPKRKSPKRKSPKRKSPKRKSPKRKSPKRKSPKRKSPKRKSPKRKSPKRKSPLFKKSSFTTTLELINNNEWFIITLDGCGYCTKAKQFLESKNIKYDTQNLTNLNSKEIYESIDSLTKEYRYFPMIFHSGKFIGGYCDLEKYFK